MCDLIPPPPSPSYTSNDGGQEEVVDLERSMARRNVGWMGRNNRGWQERGRGFNNNNRGRFGAGRGDFFREDRFKEGLDERDPGGGLRDSNSGSSTGGQGFVGSSINKEQEVAQKSGAGSQDSRKSAATAVGQVMPQQFTMQIPGGSFVQNTGMYGGQQMGGFQALPLMQQGPGQFAQVIPVGGGIGQTNFPDQASSQFQYLMANVPSNKVLTSTSSGLELPQKNEGREGKLREIICGRCKAIGHMSKGYKSHDSLCGMQQRVS